MLQYARTTHGQVQDPQRQKALKLAPAGVKVAPIGKGSTRADELFAPARNNLPIPPDLLIDTLDIIVQYLFDQRNDVDPFPFTVSRVCRQWRDTVFDTPSLWTNAAPARRAGSAFANARNDLENPLSSYPSSSQTLSHHRNLLEG